MKIFLNFIFFSSIALADGMINIRGEFLQKCSEANCQIKVGPQLYILDVKRLSVSQRKIFKAKNAGDSIDETVAMAAVSDVKDIKK